MHPDQTSYNLGSKFASELNLAPPPACQGDDEPQSPSEHTICWLFKDGRP